MENTPPQMSNNNIVIPDSQFNYDNLHLADPISIQGGSYFTKITNNQYPLYVQTPKCMTLKGFVKSGKKIHSDLIFNNNDDVFIQWLVDLESKCEDLIYQKSSDWFQSPLELDDIQNAFNSCVKIQKTGNYVLRTNVKINSLTQDPLIRIYNESESILSMEDVIPDTNIIVILEIKGVKFTSKNFQLEAEMKQVMVLNKDLFENCLIRPTTTPVIIQNQVETPSSTLGAVETEKNSQKDINNVIEEKKDSSEYTENPKDEDYRKNMNEFSDELSDDEESFESDDDSVVKLTLGEQLMTLEDIDNIDDDNGITHSHEVKTENEIASANILSENTGNLEKTIDLPSSTNSPQKINQTPIPEITLESINKEKQIVENILEDIKPNSPTSNVLNEFEIDSSSLDKEVLELKKPSEYYYELYKKVRETARQQKQLALENYMKAKNIKNSYMLDDISDTSDEIQNIGSDIDEEMEMTN